MTITATLAQPDLTVTPGVQITTELTVRNDGTTVDSFGLELLGTAAAWASIEPRELSLYPGSSGTAVITFSPPQNAEARAGVVPFAVRVTSRSGMADTLVPEGLLHVRPYVSTTVSLTPRITTARLIGRHELYVDNRGNTDLIAGVTASDQDGMLFFDIPQDHVSIPAGTTVKLRVRAKPQRRMWVGQNQSRPFQVVLTPDQAPAQTADGVYVQQPLLPKWTGKALVGLVLLVGLAAGLWFMLLRPTVRSVAREATVKPVAAVKSQASAAASKADAAAKKADSAQETAKAVDAQVNPSKGGGAKPSPSASASGGSGSGSGPTNNVSGLAGTPDSNRLSVKAPTGGSATAQYVVPKGKTFSVTDLVLQNPQGDQGNLTLLRGDDELLSESLVNFRSLDYHFLTPIVVEGGKPFQLKLDCAAPGLPAGSTTNATTCAAAVYLGGMLATAPSPSPNPA